MAVTSTDVLMLPEQFSRLPALFREIILTDLDIALDRERGLIDLRTRARRKGLSQAAADYVRQQQAFPQDE